MRVWVLLLALVAAGCAKLAPVAPDPGPFRLSGTVSRIDGATVSALAGAALTVTDGVNLNAQTTTDAAGHYAFAALYPGRFTLTISATGHVAITPLIELHEDTGANFALKKQ